jgi:hypothetical protein
MMLRVPRCRSPVQYGTNTIVKSRRGLRGLVKSKMPAPGAGCCHDWIRAVAVGRPCRSQLSPFQQAPPPSK